MKHAIGPRPDDDDTITTPLRTGPERVRHGSPGPRHVQTRGVEEGRGPEGLIAAASERWLAGRLVERSGGRRTRALRCAAELGRRRSCACTNRVCCPRNLDEGPWKPQQGDTEARARGRQRTGCRGAPQECTPRADYCRRAALRDVARRTRAELRSRGAGQGRPRGRPQPAARGRGSQQPRHVGAYCHCPGRMQPARQPDTQPAPVGAAPEAEAWGQLRRAAGRRPCGCARLRLHTVLFETRHRATNEAPCAAPHG